MTTLEKMSADMRIYSFEFGAMEEFGEGDAVSSATVTASPSGLTLGSPTCSGSTVSLEISGGSVGTYSVVCVATTAGGSVIEGRGQLVVG